MKDLTDEMIATITYGTETRNWEFKAATVFGSRVKRKYEIVRAIFSLANTPAGGTVIIGIKQGRNRTNGVKLERTGLTKRQFSSFDNEDDIGRFINPKCNQTIKFEVFGGEVDLQAEGKKKFVVIKVLESKSSMPIICTHDFKTKDSHCRLLRNTIYIRSVNNPVESKAISSQEEWEELMGRLLENREKILHKDLMALCNNIKKPAKIVTIPKKTPTTAEYEKVLKRDKLK